MQVILESDRSRVLQGRVHTFGIVPGFDECGDCAGHRSH